MAKIQVLLVDDHTIMREGIRALLEVYDGIEIVGEAAEGQEAVTKVQQLRPDVVVMDIAMPGMDGLEATRHIKKNNPRVKILILTQHENKEYILAAIKAGSAGYVLKKAAGSELVSAIQTVYHGGSFLYPAAATTLIKQYLSRPDEEPYDRMTVREKEILKLITEGCTSREIAGRLLVSPKWVVTRRAGIMRKLDIHNHTDLVRYAMRKGLVGMDTPR